MKLNFPDTPKVRKLLRTCYISMVQTGILETIGKKKQAQVQRKETKRLLKQLRSFLQEPRPSLSLLELKEFVKQQEKKKLH